MKPRWVLFLQIKPASILPGGVDSVADGDNVARPTHIQVWSREGDEAWVSHSMLVPTQHNTQAEGWSLDMDQWHVSDYLSIIIKIVNCGLYSCSGK